MFRSVDHALRFAFELEHIPIIAQVDTMVNTKAGGWRGLTTHDLHAQAALIRRRVDTFPALERDYLKAYFGYAVDRHQGVLAIAQWTILQQPTGVHRRRAYIRMVEQFCGRGSVGGIEEIRCILKCRKSDALAKRKGVWSCLDRLHERAITLAVREFSAVGLVPAFEFDAARGILG